LAYPLRTSCVPPGVRVPQVENRCSRSWNPLQCCPQPLNPKSDDQGYQGKSNDRPTAFFRLMDDHRVRYKAFPICKPNRKSYQDFSGTFLPITTLYEWHRRKYLWSTITHNWKHTVVAQRLKILGRGQLRILPKT
jgi:hypothetical protein